MAYPKAWRRLAYELWRENRSQTATEVQVLLKQVLEGEEIPVDTVMDWKNRDDWEGQWVRDVQGNSPQVIEQISSGLGVATLGAIQLLERVSDPDFTAPKEDAPILAIKVNAARTLLQAELSLIAMSQPKNPKEKKRNISISATASNQELLALEAEARSTIKQ